MKQLKEYRALDSKVLVVAVEGDVGDWAAYIGAVPGNNHFKEIEIVASHGTKLDKEIAELIFPNWAKSYRWRY